METTTHAQDREFKAPGELIVPVLEDLQTVVANVTPEMFGRPTPCPDFDVARLRAHILGWMDYYGIAFEDPDGASVRPDPNEFAAPDDPKEGAAVIAEAAAKIAKAVDGGIADRPVKVVRSSMPGTGALTMAMWEALVHGNDLATATGQSWQPPEEAAEMVLGFGRSTLTDEYRGPAKDFSYAVPVADDASALDRLTGFSGRDPHWTPPTR
jgi:uncharacterized protein (TIGR03086 family)